MRIVITGGSGFIGTNAVEFFLGQGFEVVNLDIKPPQNPAHAAFWQQCDVRDLERYRNAVMEVRPEYFVHLAARTDLEESRSIEGYDTNTKGVSHTVDILSKIRTVKRAIFASSRMVCRIDYVPKHDEDYCPPNLYGESKVIGERIVRTSDLPLEWVLVRPTSIWGPWFDVPYRLYFDAIRRHTYVHPGRHNPPKSFGYVGNTVYQLSKLISAPADLVHRKTMYLCDYPPLDVRSWSHMIARGFDRRSIPTVPMPVLKMIAFAGDVLAGAGWYRVPLTTFRLNNLITPMVYDTTALEKICGELPHSTEEGVRRTIAWMHRS